MQRTALSPSRLTLKTSLPLPPALEKPQGRDVQLLPTRSVHIADTYGFHQVPGNIQPVLTVLGNIQDAHMDSIPGPARIAVSAIGLVDTAMTQLNATNTGYRQTLSAFSTVVNGITRVCHPNGRQSSLTDDHA